MALAPLRYQLVDIPLKLHHPMWVENDDIDLDYHVRQARVPAPGGRRELDQLIGEIASTPLDRSRPLWEMYVAEGLADNRIAIIHKVHHVLADGVASANQMAMAMEPHAAVRRRAGLRRPDVARTRRGSAEGRRPRPRRADPEAAAAGAARRRPGCRGSDAGPRSAARTPTWLAISPRRTCFINHRRDARGAGSRRHRWRSPTSRRPAKHLGVTLNDVVLAMAAGALRRLLLRYDGRADAPLIAGVPVSYNTSPDRLVGNEFTYMTPSLPVHIDDPLERVRLTSLSTKIAKENHQLLGPTVLPAWLSYLPPALAPRVFRRQAQPRRVGQRHEPDHFECAGATRAR